MLFSIGNNTVTLPIRSWVISGQINVPCLNLSVCLFVCLLNFPFLSSHTVGRKAINLLLLLLVLPTFIQFSVRLFLLIGQLSKWEKCLSKTCNLGKKLFFFFFSMPHILWKIEHRIYHPRRVRNLCLDYEKLFWGPFLKDFLFL